MAPSPKASQNTRQRGLKLFTDSASPQAVGAEEGVFAPGDEGHVSLKSYIAQRMQAAGAENTPAAVHPPPSAPQTPQPPSFTNEMPTALRVRHSFGGQLYGLDTEMNSGIEHMLPTPAIRLRIIKERLVREIAQVEEQLAQYGALHHVTAKIAQKQQVLQQKLETLRAPELQVDSDLASLYANSATVMQLSNGLQQAQATVAETLSKAGELLSLKPVLNHLNPERAQFDALNDQVQAMQAVLQHQITRRNADAGEISDIINQYDATVRQLDTLMAKLQAKPTGWQQLQQLQVPVRQALYKWFQPAFVGEAGTGG